MSHKTLRYGQHYASYRARAVKLQPTTHLKRRGDHIAETVARAARRAKRRLRGR